jgi:hypothetical protein
MRTVDPAEWDLSGMHDRARAERLLRDERPEDLIDRVASEALDGKVSIDATWRWQPGKLMVDCSRAIIVIPLTIETFDDLLNGRFGYRAQYYLSVEEGQQFNRRLVTSLCTAAKQIFERAPKGPGWEITKRSISGPYSKVSVHDDFILFPEAPRGEFMPRRWALRAAHVDTVWLTAPQPARPAIDLKGTWLDDNDRSYRLDELKEDRDQIYHESGGA